MHATYISTTHLGLVFLSLLPRKLHCWGHKMIHILTLFVVLFRLSAPCNGLPVIDEQQNGISGTGKIENVNAPKKVYTSSMFEHWIKPGSRSLGWSYSDPSAWASLPASSCGGQKQSPIDIIPKSSVTKAFIPFTFHNYGNFDKMQVLNNGHTVVFSLPNDVAKGKKPYITDGGLDDKYEFHSFHLHWGSDSSVGSEHLIRSRSYPAELHLVHYNTKYGTFEKAITHSDGLAVLGIFIALGPYNEFFQPLVDQLNEVVEDAAETVLNRLVSFKDLLPKKTSSFFRYSGSLTTPKCNEIVTWTVFENPLIISERQLNKFRSLRDAADNRIVNNYRPAQQVEGRIIFYRRFTGCDKGQPPSLSASYFWDRFKWAQCLINFALTWPQNQLP